MKTYIYTLEHPETGEIRYVGKTTNIKRRLYQHTNKNFQLKSNSHLAKWLLLLIEENRKPIMKIIDDTENDWQEIECKWIKKFKDDGCNLCNITKGGEGTGDYLSKKVSIYDIEGNYIETFDSLIKCSIELNCNHTAISANAKGKTKLVKNFQVRYGDGKENIGKVRDRIIRKDAIPIHQYDKNNKFLKEWNSILEASNSLKIDRANLMRSINQENKTTKGFIWKTKSI